MSQTIVMIHGMWGGLMVLGELQDLVLKRGVTGAQRPFCVSTI